MSDPYGTPVAFRASPEERAGLKARAEAHGRSVSDELRAIVARALDPAHEFDLAPALAAAGVTGLDEPRPRSRARARRTDPTTSHEAAASVTDLTAKQAAVLEVLRRFGPMTDEALVWRYRREVEGLDRPLYGRSIGGVAQAWRSPYPAQSESGIRTRRAELVDRGLVRAADANGRTHRGRRCTTWAVAA